MWSTTVYGSPAPKGSLVPFLDRRTGRAMLKEDASPALKGWRKLVGMAGAQIRARAAESLATGPVAVEAVVTLARPDSVKPAQRRWPWKRSVGHGDVDKLARTILDAFGDAGLYSDDAQVCHLDIWKCYPDTPGVPDRLDRPGAVIRVGQINDLPTDLIIPTGHGDALEVAVEDGRVRIYRSSNLVDSITLTPKAASALARALDHQARATREAVLI